MQKIVIRYVKSISVSTGINQVLLGQEIFDDICEALIPRVDPNSKAFLVKRFNGTQNYRWDIESVSRVANSNAPITYEVIVSQYPTAQPIVYLSTTQKKTLAPLNKIVKPYSLVEIEYGFFQDIIKENGDVTSNKRYTNTLQKGEMRKRRLGVVVKVNNSSLQVMPITADCTQAGGKNVIELGQGTLSQLDFYGGGKRSFALCDMVATVSANRIYPPAQAGTKIRSTSYKLKLNKSDRSSLIIAMIQSSGYSTYIEDLKELADLRHSNAVLKAEIEELNVYKKLAEVMSGDIDGDLRVARDWLAEEKAGGG
ncbi:type II toxin-antitoxin system PemK/MazF family toxin [Pseudomonas viridiflava]|uniref:type II toxin-antitoxin system PemK/MazF family toxin n=1 Tax=Pseudomonas viridiflava TaxID=33069 RepID=UPI000F023C0B|nr:type II toxin-antitoxin system PemK/MazF family toxin [Pseudomonas viridiflava]